MLPFIFESASNALALLPSITTLITTESAIATKTPTHSRKSASPPVTLRTMFTASAISPAAISIKSIGSVAASQSLLSNESCFFRVSEFSPYFALFSAALSFVSPVCGFEPNSLSNSSLLLKNSLIFSSCPAKPVNFLQIKKLTHGIVPCISQKNKDLCTDAEALYLPAVCMSLVN